MAKTCKTIMVGLLCFAFLQLPACYAGTEKDQVNVSISDPVVKKAFASASENPTTFLGYMPEPKVVEGSPEFMNYALLAFNSAKKADWTAVVANASHVLEKHPDLLDIAMLKAIAEQKLGKVEACSKDIQYIEIIRKERASGKTRSKDNSRDLEPDELYGRLKDNHQLSEIRKHREKEYEDLYALFSQGINAYI